MMAVLVEYHILHVLQDMVSSYKSPDFLIFLFLDQNSDSFRYGNICQSDIIAAW